MTAALARRVRIRRAPGGAMAHNPLPGIDWARIAFVSSDTGPTGTTWLHGGAIRRTAVLVRGRGVVVLSMPAAGSPE